MHGTHDFLVAHARTSTGTPLSLLVDSAAPGLYLDASVVRGLSHEEQSTGRLTSLTIASLTLQGVPFVEIDATVVGLLVPAIAMDPTGESPRVNGLIGLPSFGDVRLIFDFLPTGGATLRVGSRDRPLGGNTLRYRLDESGFPTIELKIGDERVPAVLDTGYSGLLSLDSVKRLPLASPVVDDRVSSFTLYGAGSKQRTQLDTHVSLGPIRVERPRVSVGGPFPSLIGVRFFRGYRVTFDHPAQRISIEPIGERGTATPP